MSLNRRSVYKVNSIADGRRNSVNKFIVFNYCGFSVFAFLLPIHGLCLSKNYYQIKPFTVKVNIC